jgi:probable phosphomutase (TIGR03848 family)
MTRFLLIRHASHDLLGRTLTGWMPGVHLNARGRAEAAALAERLASAPIAAIATSPLERARETAEAIAAPLMLVPEVCEGLGEIDFGDWTGLGFAELEGLAAWKAFNASHAAVRPPGGESRVAVQARVVGALEDLRARHPDATVAVVSHGDVIKAAIAAFIGVSLDLLQRFEIEPASVSVLEVADRHASLRSLNAAPSFPPAATVAEERNTPAAIAGDA